MTVSNKALAADFLNGLITHNKTPGTQYIVVKDDIVFFEHNTGLAEFETSKPVTNQTLFNACSVTKTFTSLAVLQLVEKQKIKLSDDASPYLDNYPFAKEITIQQFLSHTSGLSNPIPLRWAHLHEKEKDFNSDEFIRSILIANSKLKNNPGEKFAYSNLNYLCLGKIIEKVSGITYCDCIRKNILTKLDHNLSLEFSVTDYANYARGYQKKLTIINAILGFLIDKTKFTEPSSNKKWVKFKNYYVSGKAYGGLIANAYSLSLFIKALFKTDSILLSDEYKKILFAKQQLNNGKEIEMTLGWFTGKLNNLNYFTHAGGGGGYYCEMRMYPEINMITAIMFNRSGIRDERLLDKIDRFFLGN